MGDNTDILPSNNNVYELKSVEEYIDFAYTRFGARQPNNTMEKQHQLSEETDEDYSLPLNIKPGSILGMYQHSTPKENDSDKKRKAGSPLAHKMSHNMSDIRKDFAEQMDQLTGNMTTLITNTKESTLKMLTDLTKQVEDLSATVTMQGDDIKNLSEENKHLRQRTELLEGRLTRNEKLVNEIKEEAIQSTARSMRDNLVFYKIQENHLENPRKVIYDFISSQMGISQADINTIHIIRAHRIGRKGQGCRPIVAQINPAAVSMILGHAKNLKGKPYGVNVQLPREMAERKKQLLPIAKEAKSANKKVTWISDKLIVDSKEFKIEGDRVRDINLNITAKASSLSVKRAPPKTYDGSSFQGSKINITNQDDIIPALHAVYKDQRVARATHNIYAYRIQTTGGMIEHYEDDGEHGAGAHLLKHLRESEQSNIMVCVTRWYGGRHLGPARFNYIVEAAKNALTV